ncbi:MAG TPA: TraB/GumN family protein [Kofleriaceae bacterium]|nr:TraB/GumN family protein [Kofleriaceae bacterium]
MTPRHAIALVALIAMAGCQRDHALAPTPAPTSVAAKQPDPWAQTPSAKDPLPRPLLWSIEKDGHTSYALGTIHVGVDPESRLPDLVWQKLDHAPTFAMETDVSDPALGKDMASRHDHRTLHDDLGDAYWQKLETALGSAAAQQMNHMPPTIPATLLEMRNMPSTAPMDGVLLARAQRAHEAIVYLEPAAKQVALLVKWMDTRALEQMLDDLDEDDQNQKALLAAYIAGDDAKMVALSDEERGEWKKAGRSEAEYDQMMNEMLYDRNASWIPAIEKLHAEGGGFIAVGAMHLIGKRSVLDLLAQRGYKVTRLTP